jgi:hypothetical protein
MKSQKTRQAKVKGQRSRRQGDKPTDKSIQPQGKKQDTAMPSQTKDKGKISQRQRQEISDKPIDKKNQQPRQRQDEQDRQQACLSGLF